MPKLPTDCPVCHSEVTEHDTKTDEMLEYSTYDCGAQIVVLENGKLEANNQCGERLLDRAVEKLNAA